MRMTRTLLVLALFCLVALVSGASPSASPSSSLSSGYYSNSVVGGQTILIEDGSETALAEEASQAQSESLDSSSAESFEVLQDRAAKAEADAEAHALFATDAEQQVEADKELEASNSPQESLIEKEALSQQDAETESLLHVTSADDFEDISALLEGSADEKVEKQLAKQLADADMARIAQQQAEDREMEAFVEKAEGGSDESNIEHEILAELNQQSTTHAEAESEATTEEELQNEVDAEAHAAAEREAEAQAFANTEAYDTSMIESASTAHSTAEELPEAVTNAMAAASEKLGAAVQSAKGMMGKLKSKIMSAVHGESKATSLLSSKTEVHQAARQAVKGGQWWLEKAPWFLPPPPEWGPMPVTMYTSYYHKPTHPHHLDYAHGIPLPHAEALNMARRTYPQPPFEAQAEASFMEVNGEAHTVDAEEEQQDEEMVEPELIEMSSEGETTTESTTDSSADAAVDHNPNFFLDDSADKVGLKGEAVEAAEVDDLTQASPASSGEEIMSVSM